MLKKSQFLILSSIATLSLLGACASSGKSDAALAIEDKKTILDVHRAEVKAVEARLLITGANGQLTSEELRQLKQYTNDYAKLGRGNIVISYPQGAVMDGSTDALVRSMQRELYVQGVSFNNMSFSPYAPTQQINPIVLSFARYQASDIECKPWSQIDPTKVSDNQGSVRLGCAQAANLAAMIVDPGDLIGDRKETPGDSNLTLKAIDNYRDGKLPQVSASSGGSN